MADVDMDRLCPTSSFLLELMRKKVEINGSIVDRIVSVDCAGSDRERISPRLNRYNRLISFPMPILNISRPKSQNDSPTDPQMEIAVEFQRLFYSDLFQSRRLLSSWLRKDYLQFEMLRSDYDPREMLGVLEDWRNGTKLVNLRPVDLVRLSTSFEYDGRLPTWIMV